MKEYIVQSTENSSVDILNKELSEAWLKADVNSDFTFPWEKELAPKTTFRALFDDNNFYFRFDVEDNNILTHVVNNDKMEVVDSDRVEIFLRSDDKLSPYYCLEMDAESRVLDYKAEHYRKFDFAWQWPGTSELKVQSFKEDTSYIVQGCISIVSLEKLGLLKDDKLQAGLYRGYCMSLPTSESKDADLRWISWIKPDSVEPDFHIPSSFGILKFQK